MCYSLCAYALRLRPPLIRPESTSPDASRRALVLEPYVNGFLTAAGEFGGPLHSKSGVSPAATVVDPSTDAVEPAQETVISIGV